MTLNLWVEFFNSRLEMLDILLHDVKSSSIHSQSDRTLGQGSFFRTESDFLLLLMEFS